MPPTPTSAPPRFITLLAISLGSIFAGSSLTHKIVHPDPIVIPRYSYDVESGEYTLVDDRKAEVGEKE